MTFIAKAEPRNSLTQSASQRKTVMLKGKVAIVTGSTSGIGLGIAINPSAAFHGIAAAVPQMKKQGWGRIINIASAHGLVGPAQQAPHVAAEAGVDALP